MRTTTVYRVEDLDRAGPYHSVHTQALVAGGLPWQYSARHPRPEDDGFAVYSDGLFGFESLSQLTEWFSRDDMRAMYNYQFDVVRIEVPLYDVQWGTSGRQVVFRDEGFQLEREVVPQEEVFTMYDAREEVESFNIGWSEVDRSKGAK